MYIMRIGGRVGLGPYGLYKSHDSLPVADGIVQNRRAVELCCASYGQFYYYVSVYDILKDPSDYWWCQN